MKKHIFVTTLIFVHFCFQIQSSIAQCIPDTTIKGTGVYPIALPNAYVDTLYSTVLNVRTPPKDTTVNIGPVPVSITIDSIIVEKITGLPAGFTYQCDTPNCSYPPSTNGCAHITGTATPSQFGDHTLKAFIKIYYQTPLGSDILIDSNGTMILKVCYLPDSCIEDSGGTSYALELNPGSELLTGQNQPNPFYTSTLIPFRVNQPTAITFSVQNTLGQIVFYDRIMAKRGINKYPFYAAALKPGIYFYRISTRGTTHIRKMVLR